MSQTQAAQEIASRMASECLGFRLRMLHRLIGRMYDDAVRPVGLTAAQLNILAATSLLEPVIPTRLAESLQIDNSTLSRNLSLMRQHGWLAHCQADDGRQQPFMLTDEGRKMIQAAWPAWQAAQRQARELVGEDGRSFLRRIAQEVGWICDECPEETGSAEPDA